MSQSKRAKKELFVVDAGGKRAWMHIGHRILRQVEKNDLEKRYLRLEKERLNRLETFLEECVDEVQKCDACGDYFREEEIVECEGGTGDGYCGMTLCKQHAKVSRCKCFAFCERHFDTAALQRCPACGREPKPEKKKII